MCKGFWFRRQAYGLTLWTACAVSTLLLQGCPSGAHTPRNDDGSPREPGEPAALTFSKSFGGTGFDEARAAIRTEDGGYLFVGARDGQARLNQHWVDLRSDFAYVDSEVWITKLNSDGDVEWERTIGERAIDANGRHRRVNDVHQIADGGYVVAGRASGGAAADTTGEDAWVAKLSASGSVEWSRDLDSGVWNGFEFAVAGSERGASADDDGIDIRPTPDGGYMVEARSVADLLVGQPDGESFLPPAGSGQVFMAAASIVLWKLDAGGNPSWQRRLTDGQFSRGLNGGTMFNCGWCGISLPALASTADGGALVAYSDATATERRLHVLRFDAAGLLSWQSLDEDEDAYVPDVILQTDDMDAGGVRDGQRDDGFLLLAGSDATKLRDDGSVEWQRTYTRDGGSLELHSADQFCFTDLLAEVVCNFALAGHFAERGAGVANGAVQVIRETGEPLLPPRIYAEVEAILDVRQADGGNLLAVIGALDGGERAQRMLLDARTLAVVDRSVEFEIDNHYYDYNDPTGGRPEFAADGGIIVRMASVVSLGEVVPRRIDSYRPDPQPRSAAITPDDSIEPFDQDELSNDAAVGVVEIAPGSYLVAGNSNSFDPQGRTQGWVMRLTDGAVDWQQRFDGDGQGRLRAIARSADGGAAVAGLLDGAIRAIRLDAEGVQQWQSQPLGNNTPLNIGLGVADMQPTSDGGYIAVAREATFSTEFFDYYGTLVVTRLEADGTLLWQRQYEPFGFARDPEDLPTAGDSIQQIDDDGDGERDDGFILAAAPEEGWLFSAVRLNPQGDVLWSRLYASHIGGGPAGASRVRLRQSPDGDSLPGCRRSACSAPDGTRRATRTSLTARAMCCCSGSTGQAKCSGAMPTARSTTSGCSISTFCRMAEYWSPDHPIRSAIAPRPGCCGSGRTAC